MLHHIVQEIRGDTVHPVVVQPGVGAFADEFAEVNGVGAMALRLVEKPADVVGDALDYPTGSVFVIRIVASSAAILLNDVYLFMQQRSDGLAVEFPFEPGGVCRDPRAAGGGNVIARSDGHTELLGRCKALAGKHGYELRIPLGQHGRQLRLGPFLQIRRAGGVDGNLAISIRRIDHKRPGSGSVGRRGGAARLPVPYNIDFTIEGVAKVVVAFSR